MTLCEVKDMQDMHISHKSVNTCSRATRTNSISGSTNERVAAFLSFDGDMLANTVAALTVCVVVFWTMDQAGALPRPADEDDNPLALSNSDMRRIVSALVREVDQLAAEKRAAQRVFGPGKWKRDCSTLTCFNQKLAHELAMDNQRTDTANPYSPGRKRRSAEEESDQ
ncbi:hypothetical protein Bbelb_363400 [Branchiostoma belcheri]|nr:hypothetical protein Bbelb_363400 [Branchiostoma belcheri]